MVWRIAFFNAGSGSASARADSTPFYLFRPWMDSAEAGGGPLNMIAADAPAGLNNLTFIAYSSHQRASQFNYQDSAPAQSYSCFSRSGPAPRPRFCHQIEWPWHAPSLEMMGSRHENQCFACRPC